jgi:hypothetical protein
VWRNAEQGSALWLCQEFIQFGPAALDLRDKLLRRARIAAALFQVYEMSLQFSQVSTQVVAGLLHPWKVRHAPHPSITPPLAALMIPVQIDARSASCAAVHR